MDRTERRVMRALVCRGHYPETPDGFRDAVVAATDIVAAYRIGPTSACYALLCALHPPGRSDNDCLAGDRDAMFAALHGR